MLVALDVETACNVPTCPGYNTICTKHKHALNPYKARITVIGVWSPNFKRVYRGEGWQRQLEKDAHDNHWTFVGHNFKFDLRMLAAHGVVLPLNLWECDTQLLGSVFTRKVPDTYLLWYAKERARLNKGLPKDHRHRKGSALSLKVMAPFFLEVPPFWEAVDGHDNDEYVLKDAEYTYKLYENIIARFTHEELHFFHDRAMPWARMTLEASLRGIKLDFEKMEELGSEYALKEQDLEGQINAQWEAAIKEYRAECAVAVRDGYMSKLQIALQKSTKAGLEEKIISRYKAMAIKAIAKLPKSLDYGSPKQIAWLLRDYLGLDIKDRNGKDSTGKAVLARLANSGREDVKNFLAWRKANKICSSYFPSYLELQHEGALHPNFNNAGTRTGRLSSDSPNLQQVPSALYPLFKAREGYSFIQYDMSAIEARLIALYSGDPILYDLIKRGISIHDHNAKVFFNLDAPFDAVPYDKVKELYPKHRQAAKRIGFSLFYGAGWRRIQASMLEEGFSFSEQECREMHENFREEYKQAFAFHKQCTTQFENGEVLYNLVGRPLTVPMKRDAYIKGFNKLVQSSASDLNLWAAELATNEWNQEGLDCSCLLFVHDFILAECLDKDVEKAEKVLTRAMTGFKLSSVNGPVELAVEGRVSKRWEK